MDNEERIRKWKRERESRAGRPSPLADESLVGGAGTAPLRRDGLGTSNGQGESNETVARLPDELDVEDARLAIIRRRQMRWRTILRRLFLFVAIPLMTVLLYIGLIATKLHQGEAVFTVQSASQAAPSPAAGLFAMGSGGSTIADAFKAREFILSRPMMDHMEQRHGFITHFESSKMDPLQRFRGIFGLNSNPYDYYRERVRVAVDVQEGILRLYVQARTPEDTLRFGNAILAAAEQQVSDFSDKISQDQIEALTRDVQNAERQVAETRRSVAAVQARRSDLNPQQTAASVYQLISSLELQLAEAERERSALLDQGLSESPLLPRLNARVEELRSQIAEQRQRLANPGGGSLARTLNEFETASARKEIAQARWESALNTLQQASLRILEQRRYFVIVVDMSVAAFPKVRDVLAIAWPILLLVAILYALIYILRRATGDSDRFRTTRFSRAMDQWRRR